MSLGKRRILITGASSGIGLATSLLLKDAGHAVIGTHRSPADGEHLNELGIQAEIMEITDHESVRAMAARVLSVENIDVLVNNAGVAVAAPIELVDLGELRRQLAVNVEGLVAVTQLMIPSLIATGGRIVNVSSVSGLRSAPIIGPYAASKYAVEALTDALRMELHSQGVEVVSVQAGGVKTPIWDKGLAQQGRLSDLPEAARERYAYLIDGARSAAENAAERGLPVDEVAGLLRRIIETGRPRTRYQIGPRVKLQARLARFLPDRVFDRIRLRAMGVPKR